MQYYMMLMWLIESLTQYLSNLYRNAWLLSQLARLDGKIDKLSMCSNNAEIRQILETIASPSIHHRLINKVTLPGPFTWSVKWKKESEWRFFKWRWNSLDCLRVTLIDYTLQIKSFTDNHEEHHAVSSTFYSNRQIKRRHKRRRRDNTPWCRGSKIKANVTTVESRARSENINRP